MQAQSHNRSLILASSSPYRKLLLDRLHLNFKIVSPAIDEAPLEGEPPDQLVKRLAWEKAGIVSAMHPGAVVIGSDQVAVFDGQVIGKPGTTEKAITQLRHFSGKNVQFMTAVSIRCLDSGFDSSTLQVTNAAFRRLNDAEIRRYVDLDRPLDCAGSFKSEAAGITLLESMQSDDPTAIIGLPLIAVSALLREAGFTLP